MLRKRPKSGSSSAAKRRQLAGSTTNNEGQTPSLRDLGCEVSKLRLQQRSLGPNGYLLSAYGKPCMPSRPQDQETAIPGLHHSGTPQYLDRKFVKMIAGAEAHLAALIQGTSASASASRTSEDDNINPSIHASWHQPLPQGPQ